MEDLHLLLPREIPAIPSREINIYFDNVILSPIAWQTFYRVDVDCARGQQQEERYTWTPSADPADLGIFPLTLRFTDPSGRTVAEGTTNIHVCPADVGQGKEATLLIVGDSETHANVYPAELLELCRALANPHSPRSVPLRPTRRCQRSGTRATEAGVRKPS
jgi:hypothetical protein